MPNPSWLIAFLVSSICGFSQTSIRHGTALAVERTDDQIAVAADSRVVDGNDNVMPDMCKIRSAGKWHFALNGMASTGKTDFFSVVERILRQRGGIAGRSEAIIRSMTPLLSAAVQSNPALREHALAKGSLLGVSVFGTEQKVLRLLYITFAITDAGLSHEEHVCPGECDQNRAAAIVPLADTGEFNWNTEPLTAVRGFVQMKIDQHSIDIGPPIQILQIDRHGIAKWVEQPDVCKSQK
jgi:hypothetical protein